MERKVGTVSRGICCPINREVANSSNKFSACYCLVDTLYDGKLYGSQARYPDLSCKYVVLPAGMSLKPGVVWGGEN